MIMGAFHQINLTFLDQYLIPYNDEMHLLNSTMQKVDRTIDDTFYSAINKDGNDVHKLARKIIDGNEDWVFDKRFVNSYFIQQNTTRSLLDSIDLEEQFHLNTNEDETNFSEAKQKMDRFKANQRMKREEDKLNKFKSAVTEHKWLYQPKIISPYVKNFLHECYKTEFILNKFVETLTDCGEQLKLTNLDFTDCIFGFTIKDFLHDVSKQHDFNKCFLSGIYQFPECTNTAYIFNKYVYQFFPKNLKFNDDSDTIHSFLLNTAKFKNVLESQTVSTFIKSCKKDLPMDCHSNTPETMSLLEDTIERARKLQKIIILYLIMKTKCKQLHIERAERGQVSSITNEYIFKAYTLYYHERVNLWGLYLPHNKTPLYTNNIINVLIYIVTNSDCSKTS